MADTPEVPAIYNRDNINHFQEPLSLHEYDGEIVRQGLTIAMIATILLNETVTIEARERALKELRSGSDYPTLHWRSLQMYARHAVEQHRAMQASSYTGLELGSSARQDNYWDVYNPDIN